MKIDLPNIQMNCLTTNQLTSSTLYKAPKLFDNKIKLIFSKKCFDLTTRKTLSEKRLYYKVTNGITFLGIHKIPIEFPTGQNIDFYKFSDNNGIIYLTRDFNNPLQFKLDDISKCRFATSKRGQTSGLFITDTIVYGGLWKPGWTGAPPVVGKIYNSQVLVGTTLNDLLIGFSNSYTYGYNPWLNYSYLPYAGYPILYCSDNVVQDGYSQFYYHYSISGRSISIIDLIDHPLTACS